MIYDTRGNPLWSPPHDVRALFTFPLLCFDDKSYRAHQPVSDEIFTYFPHQEEEEKRDIYFSARPVSVFHFASVYLRARLTGRCCIPRRGVHENFEVKRCNCNFTCESRLLFSPRLQEEKQHRVARENKSIFASMRYRIIILVSILYYLYAACASLSRHFLCARSNARCCWKFCEIAQGNSYGRLGCFCT